LLKNFSKIEINLKKEAYCCADGEGKCGQEMSGSHKIKPHARITSEYNFACEAKIIGF
jgi:hypothetical protein